MTAAPSLRKELLYHLHNLRVIRFLSDNDPAPPASPKGRCRADSLHITNSLARTCLQQLGGMAGAW